MTQVIAMRREPLTSCGRSMDMKRTRMCGMPKYPRPQASDETSPTKPTALPVDAFVKTDCR